MGRDGLQVKSVLYNKVKENTTKCVKEQQIKLLLLFIFIYYCWLKKNKIKAIMFCLNENLKYKRPDIIIIPLMEIFLQISIQPRLPYWYKFQNYKLISVIIYSCLSVDSSHSFPTYSVIRHSLPILLHILLLFHPTFSSVSSFFSSQLLYSSLIFHQTIDCPDPSTSTIFGRQIFSISFRQFFLGSTYYPVSPSDA